MSGYRWRSQLRIVGAAVRLEVCPLKATSITWHWELMFARPMFEPDSTYQRELLDATAQLVDAAPAHHRDDPTARPDTGEPA